MKRFILALTLPLLMACNEEIKEENQRLTTENEELMRENEQKDSLINDFVTSFTRVQENLLAIREKEERIQDVRDGNLETSLNAREEIIRDIEAINELLSENRQALANLQDKLKRYQYENSKFKRMVSDLQNQANAKDSQVVVLKENLASLNFEMEALNNKYVESEEARKEQQERLRAQQEALNTAYYAIGTYKELNENEVLTKTGGIIGLGRTKTLPDDFNRDYFTRIDIRETQQIPLDVEDDVELISKHKKESYKLHREEKKVKSLEITDPQVFWESTKYLVILID